MADKSNFHALVKFEVDQKLDIVKTGKILTIYQIIWGGKVYDICVLMTGTNEKCKNKMDHMSTAVPEPEKPYKKRKMSDLPESTQEKSRKSAKSTKNDLIETTQQQSKTSDSKSKNPAKSSTSILIETTQQQSKSSDSKASSESLKQLKEDLSDRDSIINDLHSKLDAAIAKIEQQATDLDRANIQFRNLKKEIGINLIWLYNNFTELNINYLFTI